MQSHNCKEMVNTKLKHIKHMENSLDKLKTRIIDKVKEDKRIMNLLLDQELIES